MSNYTVGYFVGSLSTSSINRMLANALVRLAPSGLELTEISIKDLPLYNRDHDDDYPPVARAFKDAIAAVDAVTQTSHFLPAPLSPKGHCSIFQLALPM